MQTSRRSFIISSATLATGLAMGQAVFAQANLELTDPLVKALGYVPDATKADKAKYPTYQAGQMCGNCLLYQGKPGAATGPCPIYSGKLVSAKGWCSSYTKKAK